jgi:hypothetical protein
MTRPRLIYAIPGIRATTDDTDAWYERLGRLCVDRGVAFEAYEYHTTALGRRWRQGKRAEAIADRICSLGARYDVTVVTHSNGADLFCRAVLDLPVEFPAVHLFAPACDNDMERNGLNWAVATGVVGHLYIHGSPDDGALAAATWSRRLFGWMGLGYGDLGRVGPTNLAPSLRDRVSWHEHRGFGHSTYFDDQHFDATMRGIVQ